MELESLAEEIHDCISRYNQRAKLPRLSQALGRTPKPIKNTTPKTTNIKELIKASLDEMAVIVRKK